MPRNGQGQYVLPPLNPVVPDTIIATAWANGTLNDMALGLSTSICTDGQTAPTANLPMAGFRHTTVGAALANNQYARADQVQAFSFNVLTGVNVDGTKTQYTGILPLGSGSTQSFAFMQPILMVPPQNNAGASTLAINTGTAYPILGTDGQIIPANTLRAGSPVALVWNVGSWVLITNTLYTGQLDLRYLKLSGGTLTGSLILNANPVQNLEAATKQYVDAAVVGGTAGVASFNTRTGVVTLISADVITALGYTPLNSAGGSMTGALTVNAAVTATRVNTNGVVLAAVSSAGVSGAKTVDFSAGQSQIIALTGATTLTLVAPASVGNIGRIEFTNTITANAVTWPGTVIWPMPTGVAPAFDAGANKKVIVSLQWDGTNYLAQAAVY